MAGAIELGPSSHVHRIRVFAAVQGELWIRHSVLLGSRLIFFSVCIKDFLFFSAVAVAIQHQGCVPAGLRWADCVACFKFCSSLCFGSVSASRSISFLWLLIISCGAFAHCYGCIEAGFLVFPTSLPQLCFCTDFTKKEQQKEPGLFVTLCCELGKEL